MDKLITKIVKDNSQKCLEARITELKEELQRQLDIQNNIRKHYKLACDRELLIAKIKAVQASNTSYSIYIEEDDDDDLNSMTIS